MWNIAEASHGQWSAEKETLELSQSRAEGEGFHLVLSQRLDTSWTRASMAIEDELNTTRFNVDTQQHIRVNAELCEPCSDKQCLYICPVQNYTLTAEGKLTFSWHGCVECGACRIACPNDAIEWNYPRGGFGVCLRYG